MAGFVAEWIDIEHWGRCLEMQRPGIVFEIRNRAGQSLFTECVMPLPEAPFDWSSPGYQFRAVPESPPEHSPPIPSPSRPE